MMKPLDYAKAAGVALALLALNVLIAILVVTFYAFVIEPGHPSEFYNQAALRIAPWCSHIAGTTLFFAVMWFLTVRRTDRNAYLFAMVVALFYTILDAAAGDLARIWDVEFALSMLAKLLAALAGAFVGCRAASKPPTTTEP